MSVAYNTVSTGTGAAVTSVSCTHTASGTNRAAVAIVAGVRNSATAWTVDSVSYGGTGMTFQAGWGNVPSTSRYLRIEVWTLLNPPTTSGVTVTASWPGVSTLSASIAVMTFTGVDSIGASNATGSTSGTAVSVSVTTTEDESMLVGGVAAFEQAGGGSPGSGITERYDLEAPGDFATDDHWLYGGHKTVATAGATNFDYTATTSNDWGVGAVELVSAGVSVALGVGTLALSGPAASILAPAGVSVILSPGTLALSGPQATVVPGAVSVALSPGNLTLSGPSIGIFSPTYDQPANLSASAEGESRIYLTWDMG